MKTEIKAMKSLAMVTTHPISRSIMEAVIAAREFELECIKLSKELDIPFEQAKQRIIEHRQTHL